MKFGVWGLGPGIGLGFGDRASGFRVQDVRLRVLGDGFGDLGLVFGVWGLGFGVWVWWFRVQVSGFRVECSGFEVGGSGFVDLEFGVWDL